MPSAINPFDDRLRRPVWSIEAEQDDKLADWQQWGRKASYEKDQRDGGQ